MKPAIYIILIIKLTAITVFSQGLEETYELANSLYEKQEYATAVEVYKRTLFFDENGQFNSQVYRKIANSLYQTGQYGEAAYYYDLAYFNYSGSEQVDITLQKMSCHLLLQEYNKAQIELFNLPENLSKDQKDLTIFYSAMMSFALSDFETSEGLFKQLAVDTAMVSLLFKKNKKIDKLKPKTAKILSMIVPGLGQFYAGDIKNGLNSFILSGTLLFLGVRSALNTSFLDAAITVIPWYQRYFSGGFKRAYVIAEAKIKERRYNVFNELLDVVED